MNSPSEAACPPRRRVTIDGVDLAAALAALDLADPAADDNVAAVQRLAEPDTAGRRLREAGHPAVSGPSILRVPPDGPSAPPT